jgi:hypothetical protein
LRLLGQKETAPLLLRLAGEREENMTGGRVEIQYVTAMVVQWIGWADFTTGWEQWGKWQQLTWKWFTEWRHTQQQELSKVLHLV